MTMEQLCRLQKASLVDPGWFDPPGKRVDWLDGVGRKRFIAEVTNDQQEEAKCDIRAEIRSAAS